MLTDIALASKAHWGYSKMFMDACRHELTVTPDDICRYTFVVAEINGEVAGFYGVKADNADPPNGRGELSYLFMWPANIGSGLGRLLWDDAIKTAAALRVEYLDIDADPNAEGFYVKMGARKVGEVPSGSIPGRMLPLMQVKVQAASAPVRP